MKKIIRIVTTLLMLASLALGFASCNKNATKGEKGETGRGIAKVEIIDGYLWVTYTDSETPVNVGALMEEEEKGTDGLEYFLLSDGTYAVSQGNTMYLEDIVIPATYKGKPVSTIMNEAFEASKIKTIIIPDSVISIGHSAFYDCDNLTNVVIPKSVASIAPLAFSNCNSLISVIFEDTTTWYWTKRSDDFVNKTSGYEMDVTDSLTNVRFLDGEYYFYKL